MKREIKFRVWDGKKIINPHTPITSLSYISNPEHNYNSPYGYKIMQYTGLKDKNGVEIYEGDIYEIEISSKKTLLKVAFDYGGFVGTELDYNGIGGPKISSWLNEHVEIIGNIYEHPELMK